MKYITLIALILIFINFHSNAQSFDSSCQKIQLQYDKYHKTNKILLKSTCIYFAFASVCAIDLSVEMESKHKRRSDFVVNTEAYIVLSYGILFYPAIVYFFYRNHKTKKLKAKLEACKNGISFIYDF